MRSLLALFTSVLLLLAGLGVSSAQQFGPLQGRSFGSGNQVLVVLLHGDVSSGGPADYLYGVASEIARANGGVTAVALLRPGYNDREGRQSAGSHNGRRDHYTGRNNDLVAQSIQALKASIRPRRVVVMGHSGGAAQLGSVIGRHSGLVNSAILVSCPCDIPRWRANRGGSGWSQSQSPVRFVGGIGRGTRVVAITGANDGNTTPSLAQQYVQAATSAGVAATFASVPGAGHDFGGALRSAAMRVLAQEIGR